MPNERMTDERLAEIEERRRNIDIRVWNVFFRVDCVASSQSHEMVFASYVPDDIDELLAEVRRLRAENTELMKVFDACVDSVDEFLKGAEHDRREIGLDREPIR